VVHRYPEQAKRPVLPFLLLVALTYLSALLPGRTSDERRALYGLARLRRCRWESWRRCFSFKTSDACRHRIS